MRGHRRLVLMVLLGLFLCAVAAGASVLTFPGVTLVVPDDTRVDPGEIVTYAFFLTNHNAGDREFDVTFAADLDWPLLGESGRIELAPNEEAVIPVSVVVPADAPAGAQHRLIVRFSTREQEFEATVVTAVNARQAFDLTPPAPVKVMPGVSVELPFVLSNLGNQADTYHLEAKSTQGWKLAPQALSLAMERDEVRTVRFSLNVPVSALEGATDSVVVTVRSDATGGVMTAAARVQVGRPSGETQGWAGTTTYQFAGELGLTGNIPGGGGSSLSSWLRLAGPVGAEDRWELVLTGLFQPVSAPELTLLQYQTPDYRARLGSLASPWTGLVSPGTAKAGFDLLFQTGSGRLDLTVGIPEDSPAELDPVWYGLAWSSSWGRHLQYDLRLLATEASEANLDDAGYLDAGALWSADRWRLQTKMAWGLSTDAAALTLNFNETGGPFYWRASLSWADRINRYNEYSALALGGTYQINELYRLSFDLNQADESAYLNPDPAPAAVPAYSSRYWRFSLQFGTSLTTYLQYRESREEDITESSDWRIGLNYYQSSAGGDLTPALSAGVELASYDDAAGQWYALHSTGQYRYRFDWAPGIWIAAWQVNTAADSGGGPGTSYLHPSLAYEFKALDGILSYRAGLGYRCGDGIEDGPTAEGRLDWLIGPDTRLYVSGLFWEDDFSFYLRLTHKFGVGLPRPHATVEGLVFQDTDSDGIRDEDEPGIAGAWVALDGIRMVRSGPDGRWTLNGVEPGRHRVEVVCEFGSYRNLTGASPIAPAAHETVQVFTAMQLLTLLAGRAYVDRDGDGAFGPDDLVLAGIPVLLKLGDGSRVEAVTAGDGSYIFPDLPPGVYEIQADADGYAGEIEPPGPLRVAVLQQGQLHLDIVAIEREKPIIMTYMASPKLTVTAKPSAVIRGTPARIEVSADMPMSRIVLTLPGLAPMTVEAGDLEKWSGDLLIPGDYPLGPTTLLVEAWDGGNEPGRARIELRVVKPETSPVITVTVPEQAAPGARIPIRVAADMPLSRVELTLAGQPALSYSADGLVWTGEVSIPAEQKQGPLPINVRAWNGGSEPGLATEVVKIIVPLLLQVSVQPARPAMGGVIDLLVLGNEPLAGAEAAYPGGKISLQGDGRQWGARIVLPLVCVGRVVLTVSAVGVDGDRASGQAAIFVAPDLPRELRMIHSFAVDSAELNAEAYPLLDRLAELLRAQPELVLRIVGHTDESGTAAHNIALSKQRAESAKRYLVEHCGIAADRITTYGRGEAEPAEDSRTARGRAMNRRVEFTLYL